MESGKVIEMEAQVLKEMFGTNEREMMHFVDMFGQEFREVVEENMVLQNAYEIKRLVELRVDQETMIR